MFTWFLTRVLHYVGWCDEDSQLPPDIKQFDLACTTNVEIGIRQGWFCRSMAEDVANIRVLPNHIFEVVLVVQKAVQAGHYGKDIRGPLMS